MLTLIWRANVNQIYVLNDVIGVNGEFKLQAAD